MASPLIVSSLNTQKTVSPVNVRFIDILNINNWIATHPSQNSYMYVNTTQPHNQILSVVFVPSSWWALNWVRKIRRNLFQCLSKFISINDTLSIFTIPRNIHEKNHHNASKSWTKVGFCILYAGRSMIYLNMVV